VAGLLMLLAQAGPQTNLTLSGAEQATFTTSDANACTVDDTSGALSGQLTDASSSLVLSFNVRDTLGDHPAQGQLTAVSLDGLGEDPIVPWTASDGTVSLDDLTAQIAIEAGDPSIAASTNGVRGRLDANLRSSKGTFHVAGSFACHTPQ
jgi:hypothetical protein